MENIKFEITEKDIKEYLKRLKIKKTDMYLNYYKYKEAMFAKYMKEQETITREGLEILMSKYNFDHSPIAGVYDYENTGKIIQTPFSTFNDYLDGIKNLDISGVCHILIPTLGFYDEYRSDYQLIGVPYIGLNALSIKLIGTIPEDIKVQLTSAIEDYYTVGKIDKFHNHNHSTLINIRMGKEHCRKELQEYEEIYGEEPVKIIRKSIRERMK